LGVCPSKTAQQSVHLTLGILRKSQAVLHALSFFWLDGFAVPAPAQVTQTVGRFLAETTYVASLISSKEGEKSMKKVLVGLGWFTVIWFAMIFCSGIIIGFKISTSGGSPSTANSSSQEFISKNGLGLFWLSVGLSVLGTMTGFLPWTKEGSSEGRTTNLSNNNRIKVTIENNVEFIFMRIPAGKFIMGSKGLGDTAWESFAHDDEKPQHTLSLEEFWMGKYPITNRQFFEFVHQEKYQFSKHPRFNKEPYWQKGLLVKPDHPVTDVTWYDAQAFCKWLSKKSNRIIRLPTEAEWEKASRGEDGRIFPWGNWRNHEKQTANGGIWQGEDTTPVGMFSPLGDSPYGCVDMSGNVDEWVNSFMATYPLQKIEDKVSLVNNKWRVFRGGSFDSKGFNHLRCAYRGGTEPEYRGFQTGFRVCFSI